MTYRHGLILALLLAAPGADATGLAWAQDTPAQLLSGKSQLFFRWDGFKAHADAYQKTALAKMMQGDTGKLFDNLYSLLKDNATTALTVGGLLQGAPPEKVQKTQQDVAQAAKLLGVLGDQGLIFAAEVRSILPPSAQVSLIIPGAGNRSDSLFAALRVVAALNDLKIEEKETGGRKVSFIDLGPVPARIAWWADGKHAVAVATTDDIEPAVRKMTADNRAPLTSNPLYRQLAEFKEFETSARAFVDIESFVKMGGEVAKTFKYEKQVKQIIEALALNQLRAVTFVSGYEGEAERGLLQIHYSG